MSARNPWLKRRELTPEEFRAQVAAIRAKVIGGKPLDMGELQFLDVRILYPLERGAPIPTVPQRKSRASYMPTVGEPIPTVYSMRCLVALFELAGVNTTAAVARVIERIPEASERTLWDAIKASRIEPIGLTEETEEEVRDLARACNLAMIDPKHLEAVLSFPHPDCKKLAAFLAAPPG